MSAAIRARRESRISLRSSGLPGSGLMTKRVGVALRIQQVARMSAAICGRQESRMSLRSSGLRWLSHPNTMAQLDQLLGVSTLPYDMLQHLFRLAAFRFCAHIARVTARPV